MSLTRRVRALETGAPRDCPDCRANIYIENMPPGRYWRPNPPPICPRCGRDRRVGCLRFEAQPAGRQAM